MWRAMSSSVEPRSEEHTSELQSRRDLVCRLLLEKKKNGHSPHLAQHHADPLAGGDRAPPGRADLLSRHSSRALYLYLCFFFSDPPPTSPRPLPLAAALPF